MPLPPLHGVGQADECTCPQCRDGEVPAWVRGLMEAAPDAAGEAGAAARSQ